MSKRKIFWLLLIILIIASFLRLYQITTSPPGLYPDEAMNGNNALEAMRTGVYKVFYPENNGREGLLINIQALLFKYVYGAPSQVSANEAWTPAPWMLRLPSAIFGIITVLGVYLLAAELFSPAAGLLSSFLLATSFWHILFSRIGFRAILAPFFLVWAIYFLLKSVRARQPEHSFLLALSGGIFYGLGFYTYIAYRVTPLLFLLFIPFFRKEKRFWRAVAVFVIFTFIVALPIGIYFLKNSADFFGRTSEISVWSSATPAKDLVLNILKTAAMFNWHGDYNWRQNYAGAPELFWPVGILFVIGIIWGLKEIFKKRQVPVPNETEITEFKKEKFAYWLLLIWLVLAALPVVVSDEGLPHALRSVLMIPPAIVLAAAGGLRLYNFLRRYVAHKLLKIIAYVCLALLAVQVYFAYFVYWAPNPNVADAFSQNYVALGNELNQIEKTSPNALKYVVVNAAGVLVRGIPMPSETVMYLTDTYEPAAQQAKHIFYILPQNTNIIPRGSSIFTLQ